MYDLQASREGLVIAPQSDVLLLPGEPQEVGLLGSAGRERITTGLIGTPSEPLHRVFEDSELVVMATAGPSVVVDPGKDLSEVVTELVVGVSLKGKAPGRSLRVSHHGPVATEAGRFAPGAPVLAFLKLQGEDNGGKAVYRSADYHFGLRALSAAELEAYGERLTALARLPRYGQPHPTDLTEWLVATAEEPLTRSEAAVELRGALWALQSLAKSRGTSPEQAAEDLRAVVTRFDDEGGTFRKAPAPAVLAAFLTDEQNERLSAALQASPRLGKADLTLFGIVHPWAAGAARSWLVRKLQAAGPEAAALDRHTMDFLAAELDDQELKGLVTAAREEIEQYEASLADPWSKEARRLIQGKAEAVDQDLRRRFVRALVGR